MSKAIDWNKIKRNYIKGKTVKSLSEKYGVSKSAIDARRRKEGWSDLRALYKEKKLAETKQKVINEASNDTKDDVLKLSNMGNAVDHLYKIVLAEMETIDGSPADRQTKQGKKRQKREDGSIVEMAERTDIISKLDKAERILPMIEKIIDIKLKINPNAIDDVEDSGLIQALSSAGVFDNGDDSYMLGDEDASG